MPRKEEPQPVPEQLPPFIQEAQKRLVASASELSSICQTQHLIDQDGNRPRYLGNLSVVGRIDHQEFRLHIRQRADDFPSLSIEGRVRETRKGALGLGIDRQLRQDRLSVSYISGKGESTTAQTSETRNLSIRTVILTSFGNTLCRQEKSVDFPKDFYPNARVGLSDGLDRRSSLSVSYVGEMGASRMSPSETIIKADEEIRGAVGNNISTTWDQQLRNYSQRLGELKTVLLDEVLKVGKAPQEFDAQAFIEEAIKRIEFICSAVGSIIIEDTPLRSKVLHHS